MSDKLAALSGVPQVKGVRRQVEHCCHGTATGMTKEMRKEIREEIREHQLPPHMRKFPRA